MTMNETSKRDRLVEAAAARSVAEGASPTRTAKEQGANAAIEKDGSQAPAKMVPAVESAIRILLTLAELEKPVRLTHLSRELGLIPSTCLNILRTLASFDLVLADPGTKSYTLGFGIGKLAGSSVAKAHTLATVEAQMREYSVRNNATVTVWDREPEHMLLVLQTTGRGVLSLSFEPGQRLPLYIGAMGRVIAGDCSHSKKELKAQFDKLRWQDPISFEDYLAQAREARERGWAADEGNYARSVTTLSVPLRNAGGAITRVCSSTFLSPSLEPGVRDAMVAELKELAARVEQLLLPY